MGKTPRSPVTTGIFLNYLVTCPVQLLIVSLSIYGKVISVFRILCNTLIVASVYLDGQSFLRWPVCFSCTFLSV
jgi:hypothetical protein